jgi:hypothetical protein
MQALPRSLATLVVALTLAACGAPPPAPRAFTWTPIAPAGRAGFVADCVRDGERAALCECVWQRVAERYSREEVADFLAHNIGEPFFQIDAECRAQRGTAR